MIHYLMCLLVLGPPLVSIAEGCGRVPATPPPTTSPAPTEPTINGSVRSLECTEAEKNITACLNGGTCYVLVIGTRHPSCHCTEEYMGIRCDQLNLIYFTSKEDNFAKAGIAASIVVLVVITIVFVVVAIVYYRRKKEKRRADMNNKKSEQCNGLLPENPIQPKPDMFHHHHGFNGNGNSNHIIIEEKKFVPKFEYRSTPV